MPASRARRIAPLGRTVPILLLTGLGACGGESAPPAPAASAQPSAAPVPALSSVVPANAAVVVAVGTQKYQPGQIKTVATDEAEVQIEDGPLQQAKREQLFLRGKTAAVGLCFINPALERAPTGPKGWYPCREKDGALEDAWGNLHRSLEATDRAEPIDEAIAKNLKGFLERREKGRAFDEAFVEAGAPVAPAGFLPKKDEPVLAHFVDSSWYEAKVVAVMPKDGKVRVAWAGDRWDERDLPLTAVVPLPEAPATVQAERYCLARAQAGKRWMPVRVVSVTGDDAEVKDRLGQQTKVPRKDLVPLVPQPKSDEG